MQRLLTLLTLASACLMPALRTDILSSQRIAFTRVRENVEADGDFRLEAEIWVMDADGSRPRRLTRNTSDDFGAAWSPDGKTIVFGATQFESDGNGDLRPVTQHIYAIDANGGDQRRISPLGMRAQFPSWSADGGKIVFHGSVTNEAAAREIFVMNPDGSELRQLTDNAWVDARPDWSPDARTIAFQSNRDGSGEIFIMNADGSSVRQITHNEVGSNNQAPDWSPDGKRIVFVSTRDGNPEIYVMNADGTQQIRLTNDVGDDVDPEWSSDGTRVMFDRNVTVGLKKKVPQLFMINADGAHVVQITTLPSSNSHAAWSRVR